jgi:hypothetical protein
LLANFFCSNKCHKIVNCTARKIWELVDAWAWA